MGKGQKLVDGQVYVNRAVFLMNSKNNDMVKSECDTSDEAIAAHIKSAIEELKEAYNGYAKQPELF